AVAPFLAAGIALGDFDLLGDLAYEWNVNAHVKGERAQALAGGVAVGYRAARRFTPLVELTTLTQTRGGQSDERSPRGKTQRYAGRRASGKARASVTPPTRISTFSKSSQETVTVAGPARPRPFVGGRRHGAPRRRSTRRGSCH